MKAKVLAKPCNKLRKAIVLLLEGYSKIFANVAVNISVQDKGKLNIKNIKSMINKTIANVFCFDKSFEIFFLDINNVCIIKKSNTASIMTGIIDLIIEFEKLAIIAPVLVGPHDEAVPFL